MTVLLATVFFTVTFLVTLVIALPTHASHARSKREVVTITQTRAGNPSPSTRSTIESSTTTCIPVDNPNIPTKITLSSPPSSLSYELIGYSSSATATTSLCSDDDSVILRQKLDSSSLELNPRSPVCSFKLGKRTLAIHPVKISFILGTNVVLSYSDVTDPDRCFDLCDVGSFEARYPETIQILEKDGSTHANNFIHVSASTCDQIRQQEQAPQFLRIDNQNGRDLVRLTQQNSGSQVVAFHIRSTAQ